MHMYSVKSMSDQLNVRNKQKKNQSSAIMLVY